MKKYFLTLVLAVLGLTAVQAQNAWDALRYSQVYYQGTARSFALGNALTAVGGDFGSLSVNPAGSALYPYAEFIFTPAVSLQTSRTNYLGTATDDSRSRAGIANIGWIGSFNTGRSSGLVNWSMGLGYNKLNDFTLRSSTRGYAAKTSWLSPLASATNGIHSADLEFSDAHNYNPYYDSNASWKSVLAWNTYLMDTMNENKNTYVAATEDVFSDGTIQVPGLLDQHFTREAYGGMGEYIFNFSGNVNNRFYFGVNLGIQNVNYNYSEHFREITQDPSLFETGLDSYSFRYNQSTTGIGFNLKAGLIFLPTDFIRLGVSVSTPSWLRLSDKWDESMESSFTNGKKYNAYSPLGEYEYKVNTPWRFNLGAAFTVGQYGFVSLDYEGTDYRNMRLFGLNSDSHVFYEENEAIRTGNGKVYGFGFAHHLRMGGEFRMSDFFALRAGYNFMGKAEKNLEPDQHTVSAGFGFRSGSSFFLDFGAGWRFTDKKEFFNLYDSIEGVAAPTASLKASRLNLLLSIGFRF